MTIENDIIDSAIEFLDRIRSEDEATIFFKKKDNSDRIMKCTLNFDKIPKQDKPKGVDLKKILGLIKKNILHIYDIEKSGWRSVPVDRVEWLQTQSGKMYKMSPGFWRK